MDWQEIICRALSLKCGDELSRKAIFIELVHSFLLPSLPNKLNKNKQNKNKTSQLEIRLI